MPYRSVRSQHGIWDGYIDIWNGNDLVWNRVGNNDRPRDWTWYNVGNRPRDRLDVWNNVRRWTWHDIRDSWN